MKKKKKVCELISQVTKKKHQLITRKEKKTAFRKEPKFVIGLLDEKSKLKRSCEPNHKSEKSLSTRLQVVRFPGSPPIIALSRNETLKKSKSHSGT